MKSGRDFPHTMDNCFGEEVLCDFCESKFSGRTLIWVWNEHTACSRACVVKAHANGEYDHTQGEKIAATLMGGLSSAANGERNGDREESDTDLL